MRGSSHSSARTTQLSSVQKRLLWGILVPALVAAGGIYFYVSGSAEEELPEVSQADESQPAPGRESQPPPTRGMETMGERLAAEFALADPTGDDWDTEKFHLAAKGQLKKLSKLIAHPEKLKAGAMSELLVPECSVSSLRPDPLDPVYEGDKVKVWRADFDPTPGESQVAGISSTTAALRDLALPFKDLTDTRVKFKIYRVTPEKDGIETMVFYHGFGRDAASSIQQNATWRLFWTDPRGQEEPRLTAIEPLAFEELVATVPEGRALVDSTASIAGSSGVYEDQLLPGASYWSRHLSQRLGGEPGGYQGMALGDVNGDHLDDVYLCQTGGLPNRLLVQQADGTLTDHSKEAGVDFLDLTRSALFADLDNDGDQDLVLALRRQLLFMENDGQGTFSRARLIYSTGASFSLSAADFDNDGDLDVYLCNYGNVWAGIGEFDHHVPIPMQDARNGSPNMLLRNDGDWEFVNVVEEVGLDQNNDRWSLSAAWEDFDNDGDQDLYVANDFGRNNLYRNDEGLFPGERRFVDVAGELAAEDLSPGMSANWGDCNNDGRMDLYISNMFSGAGNRITFQDRFMPEADSSIRQQFQRHARGNSLLLNQGGGKPFQDATSEAGVGVGRWAWSSTFADLNNDTFSDILVANGYVTETDTTDL